MAQPVNIPGVGTVNFPDGMSNDDISAAIQKNYPQLTTPTTQHPQDSQFLTDIKGLGNEAARVGVKAVTGLPIMAEDMGVGVRNLISKLSGGSANQYRYPSEDVDAALDSAFPKPTTRGGKISEGLSTLIASLGMPGPAVTKPIKQSLTGADAVKAEAMAQARNAGVVIPPSLTKNPPAVANALNGWGGATETLKLARDANTPAINALVAKDIGLDAGSQLTTGAQGTITGQISDAAKAGYAPLRDIGQVPVDQAHLDFVKGLGQADRGAANISPALGNPEISNLSKALTPAEGKSFDSGDIVDAISALRAKATDAFAAGNKTLGKAYKQAAGGFESLLDRHLSNQGEGSKDLLSNYRLARTRIAKGNDAAEALNPATGDIDPRVLAAMDQGQLSGGSKTAATIARAFPDAVVPAKGTAPGVTAFQANMAPEAIASGPAGIASVLAGLAGRGLARNKVLSDSVQMSLMQPKGKTLSRAALDAVHANPAAFAALYGDKDLYGQQNQ